MNAVGATDSTYMFKVMEKGMRTQSMALVNLMDVSRKTDTTMTSPLGGFGIGGMVDITV